jgi:hypothetical protein
MGDRQDQGKNGFFPPLTILGARPLFKRGKALTKPKNIGIFKKKQAETYRFST